MNSRDLYKDGHGFRDTWTKVRTRCADHIACAFDSLRAVHATELRVEWKWDRQGNKYHFHSFGRLRGSAKGNGAKALHAVCALADGSTLTLTLWTQSPRLHAYYEAFGFKKVRTDWATHFERTPCP